MAVLFVLPFHSLTALLLDVLILSQIYGERKPDPQMSNLNCSFGVSHQVRPEDLGLTSGGYLCLWRG